jgi:CHAT domain-containing protein
VWIPKYRKKVLVGAVKAKTLIWSLDGTLRYVPVGALWDGKLYLVERFQNVVIALASRSKLAREPIAVTQWRGLGVGVSKSRGRFPVLAAVPDELKRITRQDDGERQTREECFPAAGYWTRILRSNLERALGRYSVIHVANHFDFLPGKEKSSSLLLGDGTSLTLDTISSSTPLSDKVELLTLSACNTATGGDAEGAEVESFSVRAQKQGAMAVLATLWKVADASTGELTREFYPQRVTNRTLTKAEALRLAQLQFIRGGDVKAGEVYTQRGAGRSEAGGWKTDPAKPYAHPYYWAPFILMGNWK